MAAVASTPLTKQNRKVGRANRSIAVEVAGACSAPRAEQCREIGCTN
jgi:hypothetical protein